jgi:hypothetical protein
MCNNNELKVCKYHKFRMKIGIYMKLKLQIMNTVKKNMHIEENELYYKNTRFIIKVKKRFIFKEMKL